MSLRHVLERLPVTALPKVAATGNSKIARDWNVVAAVTTLPEESRQAEVQQTSAEMLEELEERAAIIEHDGEHEPEAAELQTVHLVQCRTCQHFTPHTENPNAGLGRCAVDGPALSLSAHRTPH